MNLFEEEFFFLVLKIFLFSNVLSTEILLEVNVNKPLNNIRDEFISFSIDPKIFINSFSNDEKNNTREFLKELASGMSPAYVKVTTFPPILENDIHEANNHKDSIDLDTWLDFYDEIRSAGWRPIIPLPYNPGNWKPAHVLKVLNISSASGVKNAIWQLGLDFDATDAATYINDLTTLRTMVDGFSNYVEDWDIIGADVSVGSNAEETRVYADLAKPLIEAVTWCQGREAGIIDNRNVLPNKDPALKVLLKRKIPKWLNVPLSFVRNSNIEDKSEEEKNDILVDESLLWGRISGEAARTGYNILFRPIQEEDLLETNLNYFVNLLFKRFMGGKVYDAKIIGPEATYIHTFCHCAKNFDGGFAIMVINSAPDRSIKVVTKMLPVKSTGPELWQYILSTNNSEVLLNGEQVNIKSTIEPFVKMKHPNRPMSLILPPRSVGFWILPLANYKGCQKEEVSTTSTTIDISNAEDLPKREKLTRSPSEALLQQLIAENALAKQGEYQRKRRQGFQTKSAQNESETTTSKDKIEDKISKETHEEKLKEENSEEAKLEEEKLKDENLKEENLKEENLKEEKLDEEKLDEEKLEETNLKEAKLEEANVRNKRQIGFAFRRPVTNGWAPFLGNSELIDPLSSKTKTKRDHLDLEELDDDEISEIFKQKSVKKPNIPKGDVHFQIGKDANGDYDYVEFNENNFQEERDLNKEFSLAHREEQYKSLRGKQQRKRTKQQNPNYHSIQSKQNLHSNPINAGFYNNPSPPGIFYEVAETMNLPEYQRKNLPQGIQTSVNRKRRDLNEDHKNKSKRSQFWNRTNSIAKDIDEIDNNNVMNVKVLRRAIPKFFYLRPMPRNENDEIEMRDNNYQVPEVANNDISENEMDTVSSSNLSDPEESSPKFMLMLSDKVAKFMRMVNHHVNGWWNTWT